MNISRDKRYIDIYLVICIKSRCVLCRDNTYAAVALIMNLLPPPLLFLLLGTLPSYVYGLSSSGGSNSLATLSSLSSSQCISELLTRYRRRTPSSSSFFPDTTIIPSPTLHCYLLANPSSFLANPSHAQSFGVDVSSIKSAKELTEKLPVIYLAEFHPEYGSPSLLIPCEYVPIHLTIYSSAV